MTRDAYLLDANVFVAAWKLYYRRSFAPRVLGASRFFGSAEICVHH
ncbi:hypothetical protein [Pyramidobacter sp. C12-8]|nr:hypothetical protein [Pyramidobacter sp. C12-8]